MKKLQWMTLAIAGLSLAACRNESEARYLDLNSGEYVMLKKDSTSGLMVGTETGKPVDVYVDTQTHDTIWGSNGKVVNGQVIKTGTRWEVKSTSSEAAIAPDDAKVKIDDNEIKVKDGDYTKKVDKDGDVKIETGDKKIKIDGETGERKVKKDKNIGDKIKKIL